MAEDTPMKAKSRFQIEEAILILLLILSLVGIGITDYSPADGYGYWLIMVVVFAVFAILIGWLQSKHRAEDFKIILREQSTLVNILIGCWWGLFNTPARKNCRG